MTAGSRFQRLQALFDQALELDDSARADFARRSCAGDAELLRDLLDLLAHERAPQPIDEALPNALAGTLRELVPDAFIEGRTLGQYRVVEALADGGMGRVYRAVRNDGTVEQQVAIKLVRADLFNPALRTRFSAERRMLAALDHPNICRFVDAGELPDGTPYVVMSLVRGTPLLRWCDREHATVEHRIALLRKVCGAVQHAHRNLIVHRDIKSDNILVGSDGEPILLDFGIAKSLSDANSTMTAERFLTPSNAAPEQLRDEPVGVGCDVYALGLLAHELLSGRPPFDFSGKSAAEIERLILHVPPPAMSHHARHAASDVAALRRLPGPSSLVRVLEGDLDAVVARCLRKFPGERYGSVERLDSDLEHVQQCRPIAIRSRERGYRLRRFIVRHRLAVSLCLLAVLATSVAMAIILAQSSAVERHRNIAVLQRDRAEQVIALLQDAIVSADPARVAGETITMRDVLARAVVPLDSMYRSSPDLYAAIVKPLVDVELSLGNDTVAAQLAERGVAAARRSGEDGDLERSLLLSQARALTGTGDLDAAALALAEVRRIDKLERADWLVASGSLLMRQARFDDSAALLQRAVSELADRPPLDELASRSRWELARAQRYVGRTDAALETNAQTLQWQERSIGGRHPRTLLTRLNRVDLLWGAGKLDEAVGEGRAVQAEISDVYGKDSLMAARAASLLGLALHASGSATEASEMSRRALEIRAAHLGADHSQTIRAMFNLGLQLSATEATDEATDLLARAVRAAERQFGLAADTTHYMRYGFVRVLLAQERAHEALALLSSGPAREGLDSILAENRADYVTLLQEAALASGCPKPGDGAGTRGCREAQAFLAAAIKPGVETK